MTRDEDKIKNYELAALLDKPQETLCDALGNEVILHQKYEEDISHKHLLLSIHATAYRSAKQLLEKITIHSIINLCKSECERVIRRGRGFNR